MIADRVFVYLVGLLWWLSLTPPQRRALWARAERQAMRERLRVIDGGADVGEPMIGPR